MNKNRFSCFFIALFLLVLPACTSHAKQNKNADWLSVESMKAAYVDSGIFDHFGIAITLDELKSAKVREGLKRHANSITMGNEMKPQWFLWFYNGTPSHKATFTASNGKTIAVPDTIPSTGDPDHGFGGLDTCLNYAKEMGVQIRGHVLTWHSQTFDWFFCVDYDTSKGLLPATKEGQAEMTARHEWYIKSVMEHVAAWEKANNGGKHIIYSWDVVNEAVGDDASKTVYLRGATPSTKDPIKVARGCNSKGDSRWYQIYQSDEFIINAFRFANKYAPRDVTLCYNDYNEYMDYGSETSATHKTTGIENLVKSILSHKNDSKLPTRIDAIGMQSHIENWVNIAGYENTIKKFIALGLDIQVTELDFKYNASTKSSNFNKPLADIYKEYFTLFKKYAKSKPANKHGITSVTVWGLCDETSWLNNNNQKYQPLLFTKGAGGSFVPKDTFFAALEAAKQK